MDFHYLYIENYYYRMNWQRLVWSLNIEAVVASILQSKGKMKDNPNSICAPDDGFV